MVGSHRPPKLFHFISGLAFVCRALRLFPAIGKSLTLPPETPLDFIAKPETLPSPLQATGNAALLFLGCGISVDQLAGLPHDVPG